MSLINVGVLRGGPSTEYEVSLKTGSVVIKHLSPEKYRAHDILIDKEGVWHLHGMPIEPHEVLSQLDVVFNALHGQYGEDGKVQQLLESYGIPFTGSGSVGSALGMNKVLSKDVYAKHGLKTPLHRTVARGTDIATEAVNIFRSFPMPVVVKPVSGGSSIGVSTAHTIHELEAALQTALLHDDMALIEELIRGVEATCGVVENWRGEKLHACMPVEIRPLKGKFFNYESKYNESGAEEICPATFSSEVKAEIVRLAQEAHKALGLAHYSRSDFIITPRRGIYILETNSLPGMTEQSLLPKSIRAGGSKLEHFFEHLVHLALDSK